MLPYHKRYIASTFLVRFTTGAANSPWHSRPQRPNHTRYPGGAEKHRPQIFIHLQRLRMLTWNTSRNRLPVWSSLSSLFPSPGLDQKILLFVQHPRVEEPLCWFRLEVMGAKTELVAGDMSSTFGVAAFDK